MSTKNVNFIAYFGILLGFCVVNPVFASQVLFERNLSFGLYNDSDVLRLQEFLTKEGVYNGPTNGNFYSLTKDAVIKYQQVNHIVPAAGYVGSITRASINNRLGKSSIMMEDKSAQIQALRLQIDTLQKQLVILQVAKTIAVTPEQATTTPIVPNIVATSTQEVIATATPALPSSFDSTLQIKSTTADYTLTRFSAVTLGEFIFSADEKIAITRLRFKNVGTLIDDSIHGLQLLNSKTNAVIATATLNNGFATFSMAPDSTKADNGLVVSGETYILLADSISASTYGIRYTVEYDIQSASDISAFDYNDLSRVANLKQINFPVIGPYIKTY